jgi:hypothetical protein
MINQAVLVWKTPARAIVPQSGGYYQARAERTQKSTISANKGTFVGSPLRLQRASNAKRAAQRPPANTAKALIDYFFMAFMTAPTIAVRMAPPPTPPTASPSMPLSAPPVAASAPA